MRPFIFAVLAGFTLLATGGAKADDLARADLAFDNKNYAKAFELYEPLARQGVVQAQSALGSLYYFGNGVEKDWVRADMWFRLAGQKPSATAIVADTNRAVLERLMSSTDVRLSRTLADDCLASNYEHCELASYAQR